MSLTALVATRLLRLGDESEAVRELQAKLKVRADGVFGPKTEMAVRAFQRGHGLTEDGIVGRATAGVLDGPDAPPGVIPQPLGNGPQLTAGMLAKLWPKAPHRLTEEMVLGAPGSLPRHQISTPLRLAHLMSQLSHESAGGTVTEENLNYSARRMTEVWPGRFPTIAAAAPYAHNPRALANKTYGGRNGNRAGTDDGWTYRGRGLIQITGRDNYVEVGHVSGIDLVDKPEWANDPQYALDVALGYWTWQKINAFADADSLSLVTRAVNGGSVGIDQRKVWLAKWKRELGI